MLLQPRFHSFLYSLPGFNLRCARFAAVKSAETEVCPINKHLVHTSEANVLCFSAYSYWVFVTLYSEAKCLSNS
jgi:hypothetical protein